WHSRGPGNCLCLSGDLLLAAGGRDAWTEAFGRYVMARSVATGREMFRVRQPADCDDAWPIREVAGLFLVQGSRRENALLFDRRGRVRLRLDRRVVAGLRQNGDIVLLTGRDVFRAGSHGDIRWSFPCDSGEWAAGGMVRLPDGNLVGYRYCASADTGVELICFTPANGTLVWRSSCKPLVGGNYSYSHHAVVRAEGDQLKLTSRGSYGNFIEWLDLRGNQIRRIESRRN